MANLRLSELASRTVRSNIVGESGIREIAPSGEEPTGLWARITSFVGFLFGELLNFGGWIVGWIGSAISFTFTDIWGLIVQTTQFVYTFNWQQTDEQLDQYVKNMQASLSGQFGGTLGQLTGWLACGIIPSAGIFAFNEPLGLYLLKNVGEEALDELLGELENLIRASLRLTAQASLIKRFKNTRQAIKKWNKEKDADDWEIQFLNDVFGGDIQDLIDSWGDEGNPPWSFQKAVEEKVDAIKNPNLRNFVEEFLEELAESCVEAGYVLAQGLDSWVLQSKMQRDEIWGQEQVIEVTPDREIQDERIIVAGGENLVRGQIPQTLSNYQLVENRDVGQWVGQPVAESTQKSPNELTLRILLYSKKTPPVREAKQQVSITLPDVKRGKLDFDAIKRAVGGRNGYTYGRFLGKARLDNGKSLYVYSDSSGNAEERLKELAELIEPEILGITVTEEVKTGQRANGKPLEKQPIKVYPFSIYLENKQKILNQSTDEKGFQTLGGSYRKKESRIEIWRDEKPSDFDERINELLQTEGANS